MICSFWLLRFIPCIHFKCYGYYGLYLFCVHNCCFREHVTTGGIALTLACRPFVFGFGHTVMYTMVL